MATGYWDQELLSLFDQLSLDSGQITRTAEFILGKKGEATRATCLWYNEFKTSSDRHLVLLYVSNHVIQVAKQRNITVFIDLFEKILPLVFCRIFLSSRFLKEANKVVNVWRDRNMFSNLVLNDIIDALNGKNTNVISVIESGADIPEELLKDVAKNKGRESDSKVGKKRKLSETEQKTAYLDKIVEKLISSTEAEWSVVSLEDAKVNMEKLGLLFTNNQSLSKANLATLTQVSDDKKAGVNDSIAMSRIEESFKELEEILSNQTDGKKHAETKLVSEGADKLATKIVEEHLSVDLNEMDSLVASHKLHIAASLERRDKLLESLTALQESLEEQNIELAETVGGIEALVALLGTYKEARDMVKLKLDEKQCEEQELQRRVAHSEEVNDALIRLETRMKMPHPPPISSEPSTNGWLNFQR